MSNIFGFISLQNTFGHDSNTNGFKMFDSSDYTLDGNVGYNLLFKDDTINLQDVGERDEYDEFLSPEYLADLENIYCADDTGGAAYLRSSAFLITLLTFLVAMLKAIWWVYGIMPMEERANVLSA